MFEKVELRSVDDLLRVQQLLDEAVEQQIQAIGKSASEELQASLRAVSGTVLADLHKFVNCGDGSGKGAADSAGPQQADQENEPAAGCSTHQTPGGHASWAARSPLLKPLSPPPVDAEVAALEAEVNAASARVAALRTSMQARLEEQLAAKLAALRPSASLSPVPCPAPAAAAAAPEGGPAGEAAGCSDMEAAGGDQQPAQQQEAPGSGAGGEGPPSAAALLAPLSPGPEALQQQLAEAVGKLPALQARLGEASDRFQRLVAAVAADINRPPPNTVERAVLGRTPGPPARKTGGGEEEDVAGASPALQQALESGQISTRRGVARDLQPLPLSLPESTGQQG